VDRADRSAFDLPTETPQQAAEAAMPPTAVTDPQAVDVPPQPAVAVPPEAAATENVPANTSAASNEESVAGTTQDDTLPRVTSDPVTLPFGDQLVGSPGQRRTTNLTSAKMVKLDRIVRATGDDSFIVANPTCAGLFVGSTPCVQTIEFRPTTSGAHRATFELYDESGRALGKFETAGRAISSGLAFDPPDLDFTDGPRQRQVTVQSVGDAPLRLTGVRVEGSPAFDSSGGSCRHRDLSNGVSCAFPVTFAANAAGNAELVEGQLIIEHNAPGGITRVPLRRAQPLVPRLVVDSGPIDFGSVNLGNSATAEVLVRNMGNAVSTPLTVALQREPHPYFLGGTCTSPVEPGATCTVELTFAPPGLGKFDNRLIFFTDGSLPFAVLEVTGVGVREPVN
jgi:hypothetical protein